MVADVQAAAVTAISVSSERAVHHLDSKGFHRRGPLSPIEHRCCQLPVLKERFT